MKPFRWTKSNTVFIPELDGEHKTVFRIAGELQQALEAGAGTAELEPRLTELMEHCEAHFEREERLMRESVCPSYEWHKGQHNTARKSFRTFLPEIRQGNREALGMLLEFLAGWLRNHMALTDRIMAAHVRNYRRIAARAAS